MPLQIAITATDEATPTLRALINLGANPQPLNQRVAEHAAVLTRNHLATLNRHTTANRLGATPTGYFEKKATGVEASATAEAAIVSIPTGNGQEAFARVNGPVTITAQAAKYLTIPAIAATYGRRAREFDDLKFIPFGNGVRALVQQSVEMVPGKRKAEVKKITNHVFYWLKPSVTLSQDRSLLPSDEEYLNAAESGAAQRFEELRGEALASTPSQPT